MAARVTHGESSPQPALLGRALAGALALLAIVYIASSTWGLVHRGTVGFDTGNDGTTIVAVTPNSGAARAGIHVGDRLVLAQTPVETRVMATIGMYIAGSTLRVAIDHKDSVRVVSFVLEPTPYEPIVFWSSFVKRPIAMILCVLAGALVMLRPQQATWAFLAYALLNTIYTCNPYFTFPWQIWGLFAFGVGPLIGAALLYFAIAFLQEDKRKWHRTVLAIAVTGSLILFLGLAADNVLAVTQTVFGAPLMRSAPFFEASKIWIVIETLLTLAVLVGAYVTGRRAQRQRIAWVVAGIAYAVIFQLFVPALVPEQSTAVESSPISAVAYALNVLSPLAVCLAVVYAMTQYRVVDFRFALNRALVYTATTTTLVALLALVEWSASRLFEGAHVEVYASIVAALLVGFTINIFHKRVDSIVDVLFFQRESRSAERLKHLAASLPYADDEATIGRFVVEEPSELLDLASAAVFVSGEDGDFRLSRSAGWTDRAMARIARTDPLIPQLRAATSFLSLQDVAWHLHGMPGGIAEPILALPIKARADLFGIILYGGHTNGATLNADERALLSGLVSNAGSAFDHIEAVRARAETQRLAAQVELLTHLRASTL